MNDILIQLMESLKSIPSDFKQILERKLQLIVLDFGDELSKNIALAIPKIIGLVFALLGFVFALIALSLYLGDLLQNQALGFVSVSGVLLLIGIILASKKVNLEKSSVRKKIEQNFLALSDKMDNSTPTISEKKQLKENVK